MKKTFVLNLLLLSALGVAALPCKTFAQAASNDSETTPDAVSESAPDAPTLTEPATGAAPEESPSTTPQEPAVEKALPVIVKSANGTVVESNPVGVKKTAKAVPWEIEWKSSDGKTERQKADVVVRKDQNHLLVFISTASPVENPEVAEHKVGDEWVPLETDAAKGNTVLFLTAANEQVRLQAKGGAAVTYEFVLQEHDATLTLTKGCKKLGLRAQVESSAVTRFPAVLTCKVNSKNVGEVVFSSLKDAEWFGAGVFESEGKGERWKSFLYKDIITLSKFRISWGAPDNRTVARIIVPKAVITPSTAQRAQFTFTVGIDYLTGTVSSSGASTPISGFLLPIGIRYQGEKSNLFFAASFQFFAYALSDQTTSSALEAHVGYQLGGKSFYMDPQVGLFNRFLTAPPLQTSSTFEAPQFGSDFVYQSGVRKFGIRAYDAIAASGGQYTELTFGAFYESDLLFKHATRLHIDDSQVQASSSGVSVNTSWILFGLSLEF